jgi:trigger factor
MRGAVVSDNPFGYDLAAEARKVRDGDAETAAFDPSAHTVDEVLAYIDEHPDELAAIVAAEAAGKARKTILGVAE